MNRNSVALLLTALATMIPLAARAQPHPMYCGITGEFLGWNQNGVEIYFRPLAAGSITPYSFHWDFDDGTTSDAIDPTHTFADPGSYYVVLTVTGSGGPDPLCRDTVWIHPGLIVDPACIAVADPTWGAAPLAVQFRGDPALFGPSSWHWDFGDGATSDLRQPTHTYVQPGVYFVTLIGSDSRHEYPCGVGGRLSLRVSAVPADALEVGSGRPGDRIALEPATNPFTRETRLAIDLPRPGRVRLGIHDSAGRRVATLVDDRRPAGRQVEPWNGRADAGSQVAPGIYFARLEFEGQRRTARLVRLR